MFEYLTLSNLLLPVCTLKVKALLRDKIAAFTIKQFNSNCTSLHISAVHKNGCCCGLRVDKDMTPMSLRILRATNER